MKNRLLAAAAFALALPLSAQTPYLVSDINTTIPAERSSLPSEFQAAGDSVVFSATTPETGREVWKHGSDGSLSVMPETLRGPSNSYPGRLYDIGGGVFLFHSRYYDGTERLWRTDGTTVLPLGDREPKMVDANGHFATVFQNKLFYAAYDHATGWEPWFSDGTVAGTQMLRDLNGTFASTTIRSMAVLGDRLLIFTTTGVWATDGTAAGTTQIAAVSHGAGVTQLGSTLYFTGYTAASGRELWKTDGTSAGTEMVTEIAPGTTGGFQGTYVHLAVLSSTLYFTASSDGTLLELWKSDGTAKGTQLVTQLAAAGTAESLVVAGTRLYISLGNSLVASDGTAAGTVPLDTSPHGLTAAFGRVFYFRHIVDTTWELWSATGTTKARVLRFPATSWENRPQQLTFAGGKLYFRAYQSGFGVEPWVSDDGTAGTTRRLANLAVEDVASSWPEELTAAGDLVFFLANDGVTGKELWRSNGTATGTFRLTTFVTQHGPEVEKMSEWQKSLVFKHKNAELWQSDGTTAGTRLIKDFGAGGVYQPYINAIFGGSGYLYLHAATDSYHSLWRTDGTAAGTIPLGRTANNLDIPDLIRGTTELAGRTYVAADAWTGGPGLWVTEGTEPSTQRLFEGESWNNQLSAPVTAAGAVFFAESTEAGGRELWLNDGRVGNHTLVKDIAPGAASSDPSQLAAAGPYLYFVANDGTAGAELWRSDGTAAGTILLKDIGAGAGGGSVSNLTPAGDLLYFTADDGEHGLEVWRTNGTAAGTVLVADLRPGSASSSPQALVFASGSLWLAADDGVAGSELWQIAGDEVRMVADLAPGGAASSPAGMVQAGRLLYFAATTPFGRELWALPLTASAVRIDDARVVEGNAGTRTARFTVTRQGSTTGTATVAFSTLNGSASSGSDYVARSGTLAFAAGQSSQFIDVTLSADTAVEGNEAFFVALTSATGTAIERSHGTGVIEDDDHRAELSIEYMQESDQGGRADRVFRITNGGPSYATGVELRFSESPGRLDLTGPRNCKFTGDPATCGLAPLAPGTTFTVRIAGYSTAGWFDPELPRPGQTIAASVTAIEQDSNPADNAVTRLITDQGELALPPFLTVGTSAIGAYRPWPLTQAQTVTLTSSTPNVTVPASLTIPAEQIVTFPLTVGNQTGTALLAAAKASGSTSRLVVPVVASGTLPKLEVMLVATNSSIVYGKPGTVGVEVAARRADGTKPTGTVKLLDPNGAVVAQQTLDANAQTVFTRNGLQPGMTRYTLRYDGDAKFHPLQGAPAWIDVNGWPTETIIEVSPMVCAGPRTVTVKVRTSATSNAPTGTVALTRYGVSLGTATLVATGAPGESRATFQRTFTEADQALFAAYTPSGTFEFSNDNRSIFTASCVPIALAATATAPGSVSLTWTGNGAHHYEVYRTLGSNGWMMLASTTGTSFVDSVSFTHGGLLYTVHAVNAAGDTIGYAPADFALADPFTDDPLVPRVTIAKAAHLFALRVAAYHLRFFGIYDSGLNYPEPVPSGTPFKAADILALRNEINDHRRRLGMPILTWTDPAPAPGTPFKAIHLQELRNAMK